MGGYLVADAFRVREHDGLQFRARLSRPAYCFWIAFLPDGKVELCCETPDEPPRSTTAPAYPAIDSELMFELSDGLGIQAFALVMSKQPLPSYAEWLKKMPPCPWTATTLPEVPDIRHHDGQWEEVFPLDPSFKPRGQGEPRRGRDSLQELVAWLRSDPAESAVDVWSIPVLSRVR